MPREFHRYTITMTILVDGVINPGLDPDDIWLEAMQGEYVGTWDTNKDEILTPREMADALYESGSQPNFFLMNDDGSDVEGFETE